jgi:hypothetical protein
MSSKPDPETVKKALQIMLGEPVYTPEQRLEILSAWDCDGAATMELAIAYVEELAEVGALAVLGTPLKDLAKRLRRLKAIGEACGGEPTPEIDRILKEFGE